jgi:hypothetical protein
MFQEIEDDNDIEIAESLQFNLNTIGVATDNFSETNKLGHGGFGVVYQASNTIDLDAHKILYYYSIYYTQVRYIFSGKTFEWTSDCGQKVVKRFWTRRY